MYIRWRVFYVFYMDTKQVERTSTSDRTDIFILSNDFVDLFISMMIDDV